MIYTTLWAYELKKRGLKVIMRKGTYSIFRTELKIPPGGGGPKMVMTVRNMGPSW